MASIGQEPDGWYTTQKGGGKPMASRLVIGYPEKVIQ